MSSHAGHYLAQLACYAEALSFMVSELQSSQSRVVAKVGLVLGAEAARKGTAASWRFIKWGFPEMGVPLVVIRFNGFFPYKPYSYWGTPMTMETPNGSTKYVQSL